MGDYHDFYVQTDTLLFADLFENFRNTCLFLFSTWIKMVSMFKKDWSEIRIID